MSKQYLKGLVSGFIISILLVTGVFASTTIDVLFNSVNIEVNGNKVIADNIVFNGTTYVPLRTIAEMLGMEVGWIQDTNTATLKDKTKQQEEAPKNTDARTIKLISITSPISAGSEASVTIAGAPKARYSIFIADPSMEKLEDKEAGENGEVTWTWELNENVKPGNYVITIFDIDSGQVLTSILLVK